MRHDSFICVTWPIHMCDMTHSYVWHDLFICVIWLNHMCDMTHSYLWHDSFICAIWLIYMCDMTQILSLSLSLSLSLTLSFYVCVSLSLSLSFSNSLFSVSRHIYRHTQLVTYTYCIYLRGCWLSMHTQKTPTRIHCSDVSYLRTHAAKNQAVPVIWGGYGQ